MSLLDKYSKGLQHVGIPTDNMEATTKFWQALGFSLKGEFYNDGVVRFFSYHDLTIETWETKDVTHTPGAINHISMDVENIDELFADFQKSELADNLIDSSINELPFWDKGIRFFNVKGPNAEIVECCQINK